VHPTTRQPQARRHGVVVIVCAVFCMMAASVDAQSQQAIECPRQATLEVIVNPASWSDRCFASVNDRMPLRGHGETDSATRDVDLDAVDERLEIRGVGNAIKQIYVFRPAAGGYLYLGTLDAHPSFTVAPDADGAPTISYLYRAGIEDLSLKRIQYRGGRFVEVSSEKVRHDAQR